MVHSSLYPDINNAKVIINSGEEIRTPDTTGMNRML